MKKHTLEYLERWVKEDPELYVQYKLEKKSLRSFVVRHRKELEDIINRYVKDLTDNNIELKEINGVFI